MDLENIFKDYAGIELIAGGLIEQEKSLEAKADRLAPAIIEHFNNWARDNLKKSLPKGSVLTAKSVKYNLGTGYDLELKLSQGSEEIKGYYDEEAYAAIQDYRKQTHWISGIRTHFYIPQ